MSEPLEKPEMIYRTAYDAETGAVRWVSFGAKNLIEFPEQPGHGWIDGELDEKVSYVLDGAATPRPATGLPATHTIPASTDWTIPDVPAGTEVEIDGEVMGVTDDTGLTLSFDTPGVWPVTLRPPFPWIEATCEVTVT